MLPLPPVGGTAVEVALVEQDGVGSGRDIARDIDDLSSHAFQPSAQPLTRRQRVLTSM